LLVESRPRPARNDLIAGIADVGQVGMRIVALLMLCAGLLLTATGCDPVTERRYITEGAGVDLYSSDQAGQVDLLKEYTRYICSTMSADCSSNPTMFVLAGMNDIDRRCDGYLTWLDARRRDKEPVVAELTALNMATHAIMTVSGASPRSLDIVTAAFGLASATYTNWNSRLLVAINQSTVQDIVYTTQGQYREKIKNFPINDLPTAIYLLRNYLRLCMPMTIEANINTTSILVQSGNPASAMHGTVLKSVKSAPIVRAHGTFIEDDAGVALTKYIYPNGIRNKPDPDHAKEAVKFLRDNNIRANMQAFLSQDAFAQQRLQLAIRLKLLPGP
jgi:hypothetical protein